MTVSSPLLLGIDTGGTFTDAVLWREGDGVLASAKALTTRHDLSDGIAAAVRTVLAQGRVKPEAIAMVSMSTTLATNALVEGVHAPAALVMIGFDPADLARDGLDKALGGDPAVFCPGGHDIYGKETPLDLSALDAALDSWKGRVSGVAVAGYFAVRNPAHEQAAARLISERTGLPVTCSHHLSSRLGGPRRALTTLLNARLVPVLARLLDSMEAFLAREGIAAPLMVVRGDGALVSAGFARARPVETILSGPAASLAGAQALTGVRDAFVADIGGTTTDIALLENGAPRLDPDGATVGGWRTMVEAVAMRTYGLGGDSEVAFDGDGLKAGMRLGPRRAVPLALAAHLWPADVTPVLERQLAAPRPHRLEGRFAWCAEAGEHDGLPAAEARLLDTLGEAPKPLAGIVTQQAQLPALDRLRARGLVHVCAFTPSDAAHAIGLQSGWDADAARLGAALLARRKDGGGCELASTNEEMAQAVLDAVQRRAAETVLETALFSDGLDGAALMASPMGQMVLDGAAGFASPSIRLDRPVIGLGASAGLHFARMETRTGQPLIVPEHAGVANAVGAVAGQVRLSAEATVTPLPDMRLRVSCGAQSLDMAGEEDALAAARAMAGEAAASLASAAGADACEVTLDERVEATEIDGQRFFVSASVRAVAAGRPRIAV
ncbi:MAG: hydantoinase/oxoprolinase family protein [Notoacmeibacter sp.]|nr:hydantoinase/oxoprolinase family protein [Notoacmeibacter sp.]MCC0032304.1 hydantoinase/oxoprolinase family protein [Brucellaceae bacterium]